MKTKLMWLAPLAALMLAGCGPTDIMAGVATLGGMAMGAGGKPAAAAAAMDPDKMHTRTKRGEETFDRVTEAFQSGKLPTSTSRDTAHPKFCDMVILDLAQIEAGDVGGETIALVCRAQHALHEAKSAYENVNPAAYEKHIATADTLLDQINGILAKAKGPSQ